MYLLDTNVVSELRKAGVGRADPHVTSWAASVDAAALYISVITVMELEISAPATPWPRFARFTPVTPNSAP